MDISMYLTISYEGQSFWSNFLEVVLDFNLPEGAIVYDSWLWMMDDTTIVKADVLDILSATRDYEEIVDRNMDPSLLYRKDNGSYQIRIFPLEQGASRKIKISYLAPAIWSDTQILCGLPMDLLGTSATPLNQLQLITFPNDTWSNPTLLGGNNPAFTEVIHPEYGVVLVSNIPNESFQKNIRFAVDSPLDEEVAFVQNLRDGSDYFYQLIYNPPAIITESDPSNILFLLDHQPERTDISTQDIIRELKGNAETFIEPADQWNFLYNTDNGIVKFSNEWLDGSPETLNNNLNLLPESLDEASDVFPLLEQGIRILKETEGTGEMVLVCNSDNIHWNLGADSLLNIIGTDDIRIHIINYQTKDFYFQDNWGAPDFYTYRNQHFYNELTLNTSGSLHGSMEGSVSIWSSIAETMRIIKAKEETFDLHTTLSNGFTYQKYNPAFHGQSQNYQQPIMEVGRYTGEGDLEIEFSGIGDGNFVFDAATVSETEIVAADSLTREIWMGHKIREMEAFVANTSDQQEIVELSKTERVLSEYTAFLALDLEQGAEPCFNCWDINDIIIVTDDLENEEKDLTIQTFPNPFKDFCTISIEMSSADLSASTINGALLEIHDQLGKLIFTTSLDEISPGQSYQFTWEGSNNSGAKMSSGIYYLTIRTERSVQTTTLSLMR